MTQGEPLAIVAYGVGIIPLIKFLKSTYPDVTQPWYTDDAEELGIFDNFNRYLNSLKFNGLYWGYYPKPTKISLIVHPNNLEVGELFGQCRVFKVCIGARYLGGYIRDDKSKGDWLKKLMDKWES